MFLSSAFALAFSNITLEGSALGFVEAVVVAAVLFLTMLVNLGVGVGLLIASSNNRGSLELFQMEFLSWTVDTTSSIKSWAMSTSRSIPSRSISSGLNVGESGMGPAAPNMSSIDMCSKASSLGEVSFLGAEDFSVIKIEGLEVF